MQDFDVKRIRMSGMAARGMVKRATLYSMILAVAVLAVGEAKAAVLSWDASGATPTNPTDGTGTWSATNANWSNGTTDSVWSANDAVIGNANGAAGTITVSGSLTVGNITFNAPTSGAYTLSSGTLALTGGTITDNNTLGVTTINSVLAGTVGLTTAGSGTLALGGVNTYTGNTTIGTGNTLQIVGSGQLGSTGTYAGTIANSGTLVFNTSANQTLTGSLTGAGGLTQMGAGSVNLVAASATAYGSYTGTVSVASGTLGWNWTAEATNSVGLSGFHAAVSSGAVLQLTNSNTGASVILQDAVLSGAGTVNQTGGGTIDFWSGGNGTTSLAGFSGTYNVVNGVFQFQTVTAAQATMTGATVNISSAGDLDLRTQNVSVDKLTGSGTVNSSNSAETLTVGNANGSSVFSGMITNGAGISLTKTGSGTLTLTGSNTYTGATTINNGTLQIGNGGTTGSISSSSAVASSSGGVLAFNRTDSVTFTNTMIGSVGLTQLGSGTLTLSGNYGYTGATTVSAGTLNVTGTLANTPTTVANAATLVLAPAGKIGGTVTVSNGGTLAGSGAGTSTLSGLVTVNGGGTVNLSGAVQTLTLSNGLTIGNNTTASVLDFAGNGAGFSLVNATGSTLTVSGSTTINITGLTALTVGTYNLITFTSATGLANFNLATTTIGSNSLTLANTGTSEQIIVASTTPSAYWKGANGTAWNATSPTNWTSDQAGTTSTVAPTSGVDVYFTANGVSMPATTTLGTNFDIHSLNFNATASTSGTINDATHSLTIEGGGINLLPGAGAQTISVNGLVVNATQLWNNNSSSLLTVANGITGAAGSGTTTTLSLAGSGTGGFLLGGVIGDGSGGGQLALTLNAASEMAILTGGNTYTGPTTITSGTLRVGNGGTIGALGSGTVTDNATLQYNRTDSVAVANVITGTGNLAQIGSGTLILTGANTYNGTTTVSNGTLQLGNGSTGSISSSSAVTINSTGNLALNEANASIISNTITDSGTLIGAEGAGNSNTLNGTITGTGVFVQSGSGVTTLSGAGIGFTGGATVNSGTLVWDWTAKTGVQSGFHAVVNTGGVLQLTNTGASVVWQDASLSGAGTVNQTGGGAIDYWSGGNGTTTLAGFSGTYNVVNGIFQIQTPTAAQATMTGATVNVAAGSYLDLRTQNVSIDKLTGSGAVGSSFATQTLTVGNANGSSTFSGTIANQGIPGGSNNGQIFGLTKTGSGTLTLTGPNSYTGATTINNGTLQIGNGGTAGSISSSSAVSGSSGGVLAFNRTDSVTFTNAMTGAVGLTQLGSGTLTLSGSYGYTGATSVNAGTLNVTGTLGSSAVNVANAATLVGTGNIGGLVTVSGGGIINLSGAVQTLTLGAGLTIGNNTTPSVLDFAGNAGGFSLINATGSTLTVSGSTTINITGLTALTVGTYNLITFTSATGLANFNLATTTIGSNSLTLANTGTSEQIIIASTTSSAYWKGGNGTAWNATSPTNWTSDQAGTTSTAAPTSGVDVYFTANGVTTPNTTLGANFDIHSLNFNSTASASGTISDATHSLTIEGGGINLLPGAGAQTISVNGLVVNATQLWTNNSNSLFTVTNGVTGAAGSGTTTTLTLAGSGTGGFLLSGVIGDGSGGGKLALTMNAANEMAVLTGSNTYSDATTVSNGTLQLGNGSTGSISSSSAVTINSTGNLALNEANASIISNTITDSGTLTGAEGVGVANTLNGTITGAGVFVQSGSGVTALVGSGIGFTGGATVNSGTLAWDWTSRNNTTPISGIFHVTVNAGGTLVLSNTNTTTIATTVLFQDGTITGAGTVNQTGGGAVDFWSNGVSTSSLSGFSGTYNVVSGLLSIQVASAAQATATGATINIANGSYLDLRTMGLSIDKLTGSGAVGSSFNSETLTVGNANGSSTFSGTIANQGIPGGNNNGQVVGLTKIGTGTLTLTGSNTYTAATTINAGTLQIGNGGTTGSISSSSAVSGLSGGVLAFNLSNTGTFTNAMSGAVGLTQMGSGTLVLPGTYSYTGTTTINSGATLQLGNGGTTGKLPTGSVINDNGTLAINRSNAVSQGTDFASAPIIGSGGLTQAGSGVTTLTANNTYSGTTNVTAGTLVVNGNLTNSPVNVAGGTLAGVGTITGNVIVGSGLGAPSSSVIAPSAGGGVAAQSVLSMNGNLTLNSDAAFKFTLDSVGLTNDGLFIAGTLTLNGAVLSGSDISNASDTGNTFIIAEADGGITGTFAGDPQGADIIIGSNAYTIDYTAAGNTEIALTAVDIPEPATWANILLGFGMLAGFRRLRRGRGME